jgi:hypothetical protein
MLRFYHDWHTGNMKSGGWKRKLRDELEKVTLGMHLAELKRGMTRHILCIVTKARCTRYRQRLIQHAYARRNH